MWEETQKRIGANKMLERQSKKMYKGNLELQKKMKQEAEAAQAAQAMKYKKTQLEKEKQELLSVWQTLEAEYLEEMGALDRRERHLDRIRGTIENELVINPSTNLKTMSDLRAQEAKAKASVERQCERVSQANAELNDASDRLKIAEDALEALLEQMKEPLDPVPGPSRRGGRSPSPDLGEGPSSGRVQA